ncbi:uncharacterized protein LOC126770966 [Nymphalis io]|uniref:uncharacterized protein LOC126770966 n=1 Tax=Inachis io TaxID=171585 RepID=UPI002168CF3B|nr:uncharacterized protein LOC126770966 [Nymphalis io]
MEEQLTNLKLVAEVEKYPCLYNSDLPSYSRKDIIEDAWSKIGKEMKMTVQACKEKWKNLRIVFMRCLKAVSVPGSKRKPYYLFDVMQFLVPHIKQNILIDPITVTYESKQSVSETKETENESFKDSIETMNDIEIKHEFDESSSESYVNEFIKKRRLDDTDMNIINYIERSARAERPLSERIVHNLNDPVVSFLNSLVPELNEMNTSQFKIFKRRALALIDNIKGDIF